MIKAHSYSEIVLRVILSALALSTSNDCFAQQLKKIKVNSKDQGFTEEFFVLKANQEIRHGAYVKFGLDRKPLTEGYYKNNQKDSTWTSYFRESNLIQSKGNYKFGEKNGVWSEFFFNGSRVAPASKGVYFDGERVGEWKFYGTDNGLAQVYNYTNGELVYFSKTCTPNQEQACQVQTAEGLINVQLDQPPMYLGGHSKMMDDLFAIGIKYPTKAMKKNIQGEVVISFFIDENRNTFDYTIEKGIGGGCDEEALNAVTQLPANWIPGTLDGNTVVAKYFIAINFVPE